MTRKLSKFPIILFSNQKLKRQGVYRKYATGQEKEVMIHSLQLPCEKDPWIFHENLGPENDVPYDARMNSIWITIIIFYLFILYYFLMNFKNSELVSILTYSRKCLVA